MEPSKGLLFSPRRPKTQEAVSRFAGLKAKLIANRRNVSSFGAMEKIDKSEEPNE